MDAIQKALEALDDLARLYKEDQDALDTFLIEEHEKTIRIALEKARKFDQLIEVDDVKALKDEITGAVHHTRHNPLSVDAGAAIAEAIDHLATSGYRILRTPANLIREDE